MTPSPGSPVNKASVKTQRAAQRAQKLEAYHHTQKKAKRNRRIGIIAGSVAAAAVVGLVITTIVLTPQAANYAGNGTGDGSSIDGVELFENGGDHVETTVSYAQTPPAGGEHASAWLNCGVYTEPVPNENAVHALEHGALWVTYDPSLSAAELDTLKEQLPSTYVVLSPFDGLPSNIVVSGWNSQLQLDDASDPRFTAFFEEFWKSANAPEPGAPCSGGIDAPGKA